MLKSIYINNFAIIDELELEFHDGMSVLTGETGAGKSIIIDALNLTLGNRAERSVARDTKKKVEVVAEINIAKNDQAKLWLRERDLLVGNECSLRRLIGTDGKSKAYINSSPCSVTVLRDLGNLFVDVYGQHEHQSLMIKNKQRELLDTHAENTKNIEKLAKCYRLWQSLNKQLQDAESNQENNQSKLDLLTYQLQELDLLNLQENEAEELSEEHIRHNNAKDLYENSLIISQTLAGDEDKTIYDSVSEMVTKLDKLNKLDPALEESFESLQNIHIQIKETATTLRDYASTVSCNPEELKQLEERIAVIEEISRKHKLKPAELFVKHNSLKAELEDFKSSHDDPDEIRKSKQEAEQNYRTIAKKVSAARKKAANDLNEKITNSMQDLGMQGGRFHIDVKAKSTRDLYLDGLDDIQFLVNTNPGQPLRLLSKVASGGELSRLSLAIQMATANNLNIPTLIFDEVDTGVGGATAEMVGRHLRMLGENAQVLCVTHLPQVAAQAHQHYKVDKIETDDTIKTTISSLDESQRTDEIARMLGGIEMTQNTHEHAKEMLLKNKT